jgi:uroporphyrinogen-III decarboxylase
VWHWWFLLFERLWSIRGMENALCDFYENGEEIHRLFRALTDFYKTIITRGKNELGLDGIWTSDDIGMQTGPFFSMEIFREFFKPYYKELIDHTHGLGMHFWLHACGNIISFIPELIEIGLDVLHPIQKYTMDERKIAIKFGNDICIWAGMDVQRTIPYGSPEDVRKEVRFLVDAYYRKEGRLMLTAGNGMTADTPFENLKAFLDEALVYGQGICMTL